MDAIWLEYHALETGRERIEEICREVNGFPAGWITANYERLNILKVIYES